MQKQEIVIKEEQKPMIPGFGATGVAGQVMCPFSLMVPKLCMKQGCESWVELKCGDTFVGRCTFSWLTVLSVEIRQSIDKLTDKLNVMSSNEGTNGK